jgi:hypothetical protein
MRCQPATLSSAQAVIAKKPEIGLESLLFLGAVDFTLLGRVLVNGAGVASWVPNTGITIPAAGWDLHLRADNAAAGLVGDPSVTLDVTLFGAVVTTAIATIGVPSWVDDQSNTYGIGWASDFVGQGVGNSLLTALSIEGLDTSSNLPANTSWSVWGSPAASNWTEIGYVRNKEGPYTVPVSVNIADGFNPQAAVKRGRSEISELTLEAVHISAAGGITRYNGQRCSPIVEVRKDRTVTTERIVYTGYLPAAMVGRGDGNDEVLERSTATFENYLLFQAQ